MQIILLPSPLGRRAGDEGPNEKIPPWMQDFLFNKTTNFYLKI
jgi:hypothetical protein